MVSLYKAVMMLAIFGSLASPAFAQSSMSVQDIQKFCSSGRTAPPSKGTQFDKKKANSSVMSLRPGRYSFNGTGALILNADNSFILKLADNYPGTYGSDGDDMMQPGLVGGCFKEQLSEILQKNQISPSLLKAQ